MKYKIIAWVLGNAKEEFESNSLDEIKKWWKENWKKSEDFGEAYCEWIVDGKSQTVGQKVKLEK